MCRKGCCGHPASNASISSATFALLAIAFAAGAPLVPQYQINITSYIGLYLRTSITADVVLGLSTIQVSSSFLGGATISYSDFLKSNCEGLCVGISSDLRASSFLSLLKMAGNGAGQGAMACFFASALCLLVHVVSTIMHACNLRHAPPPCAYCCASAPLGLTFMVLGYLLLVAGAAIVWGVFGGLAVAAAAYAQLGAGLLLANVWWFPLGGPVMAGLALAFATIALFCELGARLCCKNWAPPGAALAGSGGAADGVRTVVVLPAALSGVGVGGGGGGGGGWGLPPPHQPLPHAVYAHPPPPPGMWGGAPPPKEAPPLVMAPPPPLWHWRQVTDGKDTCACCARCALRSRCRSPPGAN